MAPLLPDVDDPVLNTILPVTPLSPALGVVSNIAPLLRLLLDPDVRYRAPPVTVEVAKPADSTSSPPVPLFPLPTVKYTAPARPEEALPEPIYKAPLFPLEETPLLKTISPLAPLVPEFAVEITIDPLDDMLLPEVTDTLPPTLAVVAAPPVIEIAPPVFPFPTLRTIPPACPDLANPVIK
jgi:hypothetical protein